MPNASFSGGGGNLGMGVAFSLEDHFSAVSVRIGQSMDKLDSKVDSFSDKINNSFAKIYAGAAMVGTGLTLMAPIGLGLQYAGEFEQARIGLTTLLKSQEAAISTMETIKKDAAATPFSFQDVLGSTQVLIGAGLTAKDARGSMLALGDAVAALGRSGADLNILSVNMQGIKANGKATAQDLKQFATRGIPIFDMLAQSMGKTVAEIKDIDITFELLDKAFKDASGEGGRFYKAMEAQSKALFGKLSTLSDAFTFSLAAMGEAIMPYVHPIIDFFTFLLEAIKTFVESPIGKVVASFVSFGVIATGLIVIFVGLKMIVTALTGEVLALLAVTAPYILVLAALGAIVATVNMSLNAFEQKQKDVHAWTEANTLGFWEWSAAQEASGKSMKEVADEWDRLKSSASNFTFLEKIGGIFSVINEVLSSWDSKKGTFALPIAMVETLKAMGIYDLAMGLATWIVRLKVFFEGIWAGLKAGWETIRPIVAWLWNTLKMVIEKVFSAFGVNLKKNTSDLETWRKVGKAVGIALFIVLTLITLAFIAMGIAALVAMSPILLIMAAIAAVVYGVYVSVMAVINSFMSLWEVISGIWDMAYNFGSDLITGIWQGMISMWDSFTSWLTEVFTSLWNNLMSSLGLDFLISGGTEGGSFGGGGANGEFVPNTETSKGFINDDARTRIQQSTLSAQLNNSNNNSVTIPINLDGKEIGKYVVDTQTKDYYRTVEQ